MNVFCCIRCHIDARTTACKAPRRGNDVFLSFHPKTALQRDMQALAYHHIQTPSPHTVGVEVNTEFFLELLTEFLFQLKLEIVA